MQDITQRIKYLFQVKKYKHGIELFKQHPGLMENEYALFLVGRCYVRLGKTQEAEHLFKQAIGIWPNYGGAKLELAKLYTDDDPDQATQLVKECIAYNPHEPAYWGVLGSIRYAQDDYKGAEEAFEKYMEMRPDDPRTIINLAVCKGKLGQEDKELELYKLGISLNPNYVNGYVNLAVYLSDHGKWDEAEETYLNALRMEPMNSTCIYGLACVYALRKEKDKALQYLQQSIELDASYKTYVLTDVDFKLYLNDPDFKKAIQ